jgi:hypothetical protein
MRLNVLLFVLAAIVQTASAQSARNYIPMDIPVRDGETLAADLYAMDTTIAKPVIFIQTPYNKNSYRVAIKFPNTDSSGFPLDTLHYNYVALDWRGFYASASAAKAGYDRGLDGYDAIEWIAKQTWSNGKVGTWGGSALGAIQFQTAKHKPPHLVCAVPFISDYKTQYIDYFPGGCFLEEHYNTVDSLGFSGTSLGLQHPDYDIYWKLAEQATDYPDSINVPLLMMTGWYDHFPDDVIRAFEDLRARSDVSVRDKHKLIIGPWLHTRVGFSQQGILDYPEAVGIPRIRSLEFFDHYLRGIDNGLVDEPTLSYFDLGTHVWYGEENMWSDVTKQTDRLLLFTSRDDSLLTEKADDVGGTKKYVYDPRNFSPSIGSSTFSSYLLHGPQDISQSIEKRSDVLTYSTDVLTAPIVVRGAIQMKLMVSTDRTDTDFGIRLCDVYPDGRSVIITDGMKRLRFRNGYETEELVIPNNIPPYNIIIELRNLAITFPLGHRLRIDITSSNYPRFNLNPNSGSALYKPSDTTVATNTISTGLESYIIIPVEKKASVTAEQNDNFTTLSAFPNPAQGIIKFEVTLPETETISLALYDDLGRQRPVASGRYEAGSHFFSMETKGLTAGHYYARLLAGGITQTKKIIITK